MSRTRNVRSSTRRSDSGVESLTSTTGGVATSPQVDGPINLEGATFVAPNTFVVGGVGGPGSVFVDGADTTSGFLDPKIANTSIVINPGGNEQLLITRFSGIQEVNDTNVVAAVLTNLIVYTNITANRTVTLPALAAVPDGFTFTVKDRSGDVGFSIVVTPNGAEKIDGLATYPIVTGNEYCFDFTKSTTAGWIVT